MNSLLTALRAGMNRPALEEGETEPAPPGAPTAGTGEQEVEMTEQEHQAALATARAEGKAEGVKEGASDERTRIGAIVSAAGIAGNAGLIGAAVGMAGDFPEASAEVIVKHTVAASGAGGAPTTSASSASLAERLKAEKAAGGEGLLPNGAVDQPQTGASRLTASMKNLLGQKG